MLENKIKSKIREFYVKNENFKYNFYISKRKKRKIIDLLSKPFFILNLEFHILFSLLYHTDF